MIVPAYADISLSQSYVINPNNRIILGHSDIITYVGSNPGTVTISGGNDGSMDITLDEQIPNVWQKMVVFTTCNTNDPVSLEYCVTPTSTITVTAGASTDTAKLSDSSSIPTYGNPFNVIPSACANDIDDDGVCDEWETGDLHIPASPGNPEYFFDCDPACTNLTQDIFVEIDYMTGHRPNQQAIDDVKNSFKLYGNINLQVQIDDSETGINHWDSVPFPGTFIDKGFDHIKAAHFGTATEKSINWSENVSLKRQVFHYVLFVHSQGNTKSGNAEYLGNDAIISLGTFDGQIGSLDQQSGTLMHELGHNLNLEHDGSTEDGPVIHCKPNYLSVMNYLYQTDTLVRGRTVANVLDFSGMKIPQNGGLNENALSESAGVDLYGPHTGAKMIWNMKPFGQTTLHKSGVTGPNIDWNGDKSISGSPAADLNNLGSYCGTPAWPQNLEGYNDWEYVDLKFKENSSTFGDGLSSSEGGNEGLPCVSLPPQASERAQKRGCPDRELKSEDVLEMRLGRINQLGVIAAPLQNSDPELYSSLNGKFEQVKSLIKQGKLALAEKTLSEIDYSTISDNDLKSELDEKTKDVKSNYPKGAPPSETPSRGGPTQQSVDDMEVEEPTTPTPTPTPTPTSVASSDSAIVAGLMGLVVALSAMAGYFAYSHNKPRANRRN